MRITIEIEDGAQAARNISVEVPDQGKAQTQASSTAGAQDAGGAPSIGALAGSDPASAAADFIPASARPGDMSAGAAPNVSQS